MHYFYIRNNADHGKRFGLLQRDRNFDHYLDGMRYHLRLSTWVEPLGDWGRGAIQLVEIPTNDEIVDNVCAMWVPAAPHGGRRNQSCLPPALAARRALSERPRSEPVELRCYLKNGEAVLSETWLYQYHPTTA